MQISWQAIHTGKWNDVSIVWRHYYSFGSNLKALDLIDNNEHITSIKLLDLSLLIGSGILRDFTQSLIAFVVSKLNNNKKRSNDPQRIDFSKRVKLNNEIIKSIPIRNGCEIERISIPSMSSFKKNFMQLETPVIIEGLLDYWPAYSNPSRMWKDLENLKSIAGWRTVPVEIGSKYTDDDWSQVLMTMSEFIETFIEKTVEPKKPDWKGKCGYVAQTELFDQIKELKNDIIIPDYLAITDKSLDEQHVSINAWFGPEGTLSPCHHDPYHNILCQVVGLKYIRLYEKRYSECLYPHEGKLSNTSQVDVENPDLVQFPKFKEAKHYECILNEGDALYIPPKVWHHVRSLDLSFSVSFWWD